MPVDRKTPSLGDQISSQVKTGLTNLLIDALTGDSSQNAFTKSNILHRYKTFNYVITLAVLSADELRTGSYKRENGLDFILLKNVGKPADAQRASAASNSNAAIADAIKANNFNINNLSAEQQTKVINSITGTGTSKQLLDTLIGNGEGNYDFFIENLDINSRFTKTGALDTAMNFTVIEPYGNDNFMMLLRTGLKVKGHDNFSSYSPFVMKLEFVGWRDDRDEPEVIPFSTRYYPLSFKKFSASLTQQGTTYNVQAIPFTQLADMDPHNKIGEKFTITGETVKDVMKSLEEQVNDHFEQLEKKTGLYRNRYAIKFGKYNEAGKFVEDEGGGAIGSARMYNKFDDIGQREFLEQNYVFETAAKDPDGRITFQVDGGNGIDNSINWLIRDSEYFVEMMRNVKNAEKENGSVTMWKVFKVPEANGRLDLSTMQQTFLVTYYIVPYKTHWSRVTPITAKTPAEEFEANTARIYEWQYTGNNRDVLNFNLTFNNMWAKIISSTVGSKGFVQGKAAQNAETEVLTPTHKNTPLDKLADVMTSMFPSYNSNSNTGGIGSSRRTGDPAKDIAIDVFQYFQTPDELARLDIEILGDPLWLGTQFFDSKPSNITTQSELFTVDGAMALRSVDPIIKILAYAPKDFNDDGFLVSDPNSLFGSQGKKLSSFSAYYQVTGIKSSFKNGVFTQKLEGFKKQTDTVLTNTERGKK